MHIQNENISIVITLMCFGLTDFCIHIICECNHVYKRDSFGEYV